MSESGLIRDKRSEAERARRIARGLLVDKDKRTLLNYAAELEAQADELERRLRGEQSNKT